MNIQIIILRSLPGFRFLNLNDRYRQGALVQHSTMSYSGIGKAMKQQIPEVEAYGRVEPKSRGY